MTSKEAVERTLTGGRSVRPHRIFFAVGVVLFLAGMFIFFTALGGNHAPDRRIPPLLASIALLPTSGLLLLTGAYLRVHQDK